MKPIAQAGLLYANRQFATFLIVGAVAAGVNVGARLLLSVVLAYPAAVALAYAVGMAAAFVLNRLLVFPNSTRSLTHNVVYFIVVNAIAFPQVLGVSWLLGEVLLPPLLGIAAGETVGHALGVASPAFSSFALHKFITFRQDGARGAPAGGGA